MKKILDFLKTNFIVLKWSIIYFLGLWCILQFVFGFDAFSAKYWYRFFHSSFHGFGGFAFQIIVYSALPIYVATVISIYRQKEPIIKISIFDKIKDYINKLKPTKTESVKEETPDIEQENESVNTYPKDLPHELRVPFMRAKNRLPLSTPISVYNKTSSTNKTPEQEQQSNEENSFPIPTDFDISESEDLDNNDINTIPTFHDINFDTPIMTEKKLENETTKYFDNKKIEYETYKNFVITNQYIIYEHNDGDFWIMDEDSWFASGKQIDSPVQELLEISKANSLIPIIYLQSENIMDIESTISKFENNGIRVIKSIEELY